MNMKKTNVQIKQQEGQEISIDILAIEIKAISDGIKRLRSGKLKDSALVLLIQNAAPKIGGKYNNSIITKTEVTAVLSGIENLEREYLK